MMTLFNINNLKIYAIFILTGLLLWFYKDYKHQKFENKRQTENMRQVRMQDSLRYAQLSYTKNEMDAYLTYQNQSLKEALNESNIKLKNIQRIMNHQLNYIDSTKRRMDLNPVIQAIHEEQPISLPFIDSTKCLAVKGYVTYKNDSLSLNITERVFKNETNIVAHLERRQWKFLGIKTRFLGKKQAVVKSFDHCGKSKTLIIDKTNKKSNKK